MKASKHNDSNLIWESYTSKLSEGTDGSTKDLTPSEKMKLAAHAAKKGKGPLATKPREKQRGRAYNAEEIDEASHENRTKEELDAEKKDLDSQDQKYFRVPKDHKKKQIEDAEKDVKEEGSDSFGYNQGKGKHWKEYRSKFDNDPGYQQLKQKMQAEYDAKKKKDAAKSEKPKEEAMSPEALAQSERDNPEFSQETWMLMKGDPSTNTVKAVKKYTGVKDEGSVQQLSMMLADLTAEQDGLPRDEHFPYETDTGHEYFQSVVADGTTVTRVIAIDEDYDLICVVPDPEY